MLFRSYARHALALDEDRATFWPELWDELETDRTSGRIRQGPAPSNLAVPPYAFLTDTKIQIG